ncbi:MAG: PQQ-dependent sugar dehydrogenase [Gemmatimonadetes bacterium]|nr:PQQ-dependent sugar dehydrogenase [Gemmatimonadota bacterium]
MPSARPLMGFALIWSTTASAQSQVHRSVLYDFRAVPVVEGFRQPWSMAFLPGGDMLVTEKGGQLRMVRGGKLLPTPIAGVPAVLARGQGGLLDVVLHPNFASNRLVYLSYSKPIGDSTTATTAIGRGRLEGDRLADFKDIFVGQTRGAPGHYGSRIAFDKNGLLYFSIGDRMVAPTGDLAAHPAQSLANHQGKILRIHDDGRAPADNPFVGKDGAKPEIFSYGHRNPQALAVHPETGDVWATEHGPQGGDELNLIRPGLNYGWPVIGYGVNYGSGSAIHKGTHQTGMEQPVVFWVPSIGISGITIYTGDKFPAWKGSVFVGGLSGEQLGRLTLDGQKAELAETIFRHQGRIRDVRQGPDGFLYLAIDDTQKATAILRLEPIGRR